MKKYKTIFLANLSEAALSLANLMSKKNRRMEIFEDHVFCDRFIFSKGDDRVMVTPLPVDTEMKKHVEKIMKFKNVINLSPKKLGESLCLSILEDKVLLKQLVSIIKDNPGIDIVAYVSSNEFTKLLEYFKSQKLDFVTSEIPTKENNWTIAFFDSKAGFRQLTTFMENGFPKMPQGIVCDSVDEIIGAVNFFFKNEMDCVMKANRGLAGAGLKLLYRKDFKGKILKKELQKFFNEDPYWSRDVVVVEEFISPNYKLGGGAPNIELKIYNNKVYPLYCCSMRINEQGIFQGIEIGRGTYTNYMQNKLIKHGMTFGHLLKKFDYRGHFEVDFVAGLDKRIYPIEANVRRTGGTHTYEAAKRLLGNDFEKDYYVVSKDFSEASKLKGNSYSQVKEKLKDLLYPIKGEKKGVVISIFSYIKHGKIGYFVIADSKKSAYAIEKEFVSRVS
jgi:hypothetical protein